MMLLMPTSFAKEHDITEKNYDQGLEWGRTVIASDVSPMNRKNVNYMYGDETYPRVGEFESGAVYLDKKSCNYDIQDGVAYISCIVYYGGGGSDGHGNAAKHLGRVVKFSTYKKEDKRTIIFQSETDLKTGKDYTDSAYESDNGFLKNLFWIVADQSGISKYLD